MPTFSVEDARFVSDLRLKMTKNRAAGLPAEHGIDKEQLKKALVCIRNERTLGDVTGSKAKAKAPTIPIDLNAFMKK